MTNVYKAIRTPTSLGPLLALTVILTCFSVTSSAQADDQVQKKVGLAQVDITPDYPVRLSGFGFRRHESEGIRHRIWAKALAIQSDDKGPFVLLSVDTCGLPASMVEELVEKLAPHGVTRERLAALSSHTHTAPMVAGVLSTLFGEPIPPEHQKNIDRYTAELAKHLEEVAIKAIQDLQPANLYWGLGSVDFAINRRTAGGPVDHDMPILVVKNLEGELRGILFNYACHCVTLSENKISGDWAGYAMDAIQRQHDGVIALAAIGCGADANPSSGVTGDKADVAMQQGFEIASEVSRLLKTDLTRLDGPIQAAFDRLDLPLAEHPTREEWETRAKQQDYVGHHARVQLERLDAGKSLPTAVPYSVQSWSFDDKLAMVFLPGEVVADFSLRLKKTLDGNRLWVNGYANDVPCYIPSERVLAQGSYEGGGAMTYYDLPAAFAPGVEQPIIDAAVNQLKEKFEPAFDASKTQGTRPLSPQQSLKKMQLKPGFEADLAVSEPLVIDPVAVDFGPDGKLWVAEMHDYPMGLDGNYTPGGRIKLVEDTNGDGQFDRGTIFLDNIPFPTGVSVWRNGVLICAAPNIIYAEDTDGDGVADVKEILFSGFGVENFQARVNGLRYGLDGWVYGSCGLFGGDILSHKTGKTYALGNRDFRINPDTGAIEATSGRTQQGIDRDNWGNWFGCNNSMLLQQYPLDDVYLSRNPYLNRPTGTLVVSDSPNPNRLFPISGLITFALSGPPGRATAACGLSLYRDSFLGNEFMENSFVCEPVNQVVNRMIVSPKDTLFRAQRAPDEQESEFIASSDSWFRPVDARTGPDGALWISDMYRFVIEHPRWIPEEDLKNVDVRAGDHLGRIYRVFPEGKQAELKWPRLSEMPSAEVVKYLSSSNGWQRDMAQQVLLWRNDQSVVDQLQQTAVSAPEPLARAHALNILAIFKQLDAEVVSKLLADANPEVRRQAIRVAMAAGVWTPAIQQQIVKLATDESIRVRQQVAYALGEIATPESAATLSRLGIEYAADPYMLVAVLSSLHPDNIAAVLQSTLQQPRSGRVNSRFVGELARLASTWKNEAAVTTLLTYLQQQSQSAEGIPTVAILLPPFLSGLTSNPNPEFTDSEQVKGGIVKLLTQLREQVLQDGSTDAQVIAAIGTLAGYTAAAEDDLEVLVEVLSPSRSIAVQSAAVDAIGRIADVSAAEALLEYAPASTPAVRQKIAAVLLTRQPFQLKLLNHLKATSQQAIPLDANQRQALLTSADAEVKALAEAVLHENAGKPNEIVQTYMASTTATGDLKRGEQVFTRACSACHTQGNSGHAVGPDLAALSNRNPHGLLESILDPNQQVDGRYVSYLVLTVDGKTYTGLLAEESDSTITLLAQGGVTNIIQREQIDEFRNTGKSLMPEGLERDITIEEMADLLAYLIAMPAEGNTPATAGN